MSDLIKEVLMGKLFGTGTGSGGSSGGAGGASSGVSPKEVNFYDYDGTCVYAYSVAEAQALSELPAGPEHPGLVFQGWNWSLEGVKGLTRAMNIGAMYTTDDGTTRLYITLQEGRTSPMLGVGVNGTVTVDWGDGTEPDVLTGTSVSATKRTPNHAYAAPGDYVIRLTVDGKMRVTGGTETYNSEKGSYLLTKSSATGRIHGSYQSAIKKVHIGNDVEIGSYAFLFCQGLKSITFPRSTSLFYAENAFSKCHNLKYVAVNLESEINQQKLFYGCNGLVVVSLPEDVDTITASMFYQCMSLESIHLPESITTLDKYCFYETAITYLVLPEYISKLPDYMCQYCRNISFVKMRGSISEIAAYAFNGCGSMAFIDFTACTTVPTLASTSAFTGIPADCIFLIPSALYDEWIAATNWATYADRCVAK